MALELSYEDKAGNVGNYWKIEEVHVNAKEDTSSITVALFKDAATSAAEKDSMLRKTFNYKNGNSPFTPEILETESAYVTAYVALLGEGFFTGALSV
jgi:hypothetical protein